MAKFRGVVQIYRTYEVEAETAEKAMAIEKEELLKTGLSDRFNINVPTNMDKKKAKSEAYFKKRNEAAKGKKETKEVKE